MISGGLSGAIIIATFILPIFPLISLYLYMKNIDSLMEWFSNMFFIFICYPNILLGPGVILTNDICVSHYGQETVDEYLSCLGGALIKVGIEEGLATGIDAALIAFFGETTTILIIGALVHIGLIGLGSAYYAKCNLILEQGG